jgi:hypothetical protein
MFIYSKETPNEESHQKRYNPSNRLPPNFKEITEKEFAKSKFFVYSPDFWEWRQINVKEDYQNFTWGKDKHSYIFSIRMAYFYDGTGLAMAHDYWEGKVRYFSFAVCEHKNKTERNVGRCLNQYTCDACGFVETIDSSD